ncbi:MAG: hypothetical protein AVDCRST_MAG78-2727, partial [uncultured Rubrobacteraceae bacterium]
WGCCAKTTTLWSTEAEGRWAVRLPAHSPC